MFTTSQRIASRFALTIAGIVLVLWLLINLAFLWSWWKREQQFMINATLDVDDVRQAKMFQKRLQKSMRGEWREFWPRNTLFVSKWWEEVALLEEHLVFWNIAHYEEVWYVFWSTKKPDEVIIVDISPAIENQIDLLWITFIALLLSSALGYFISIYVVKRGLRDLHTLAQKVQAIDIDSLQQSRTFPHLPDHDEIQIVAHALEKMTKKVHTQVATIKQFVANVSHEFKTPLMSLQSTIDLGEKIKQYDQLFPQIREQIWVMHRLLDTLTWVMYAQKDKTIKKEQIFVAPIIDSLVESMHHLHPDVQFTSSVEADLSIMSHQWMFERVLTNLLDNAGKFTSAWWIVTLIATAEWITITDTWAGISAEQLTKIWDPFWQWDAARETTGFWLGLSLVQQLVTLLDWDIVIKSTLWEGTTVTLKW